MQYGGLGQSPLFSGGGYLTPSIPSGSSTCFPYEAPQQGLAFHQTAPVAAQSLVGNVATWYSGMSPHKYEVVTLTPSAKCCYGCGNSFADKYRRQESHGKKWLYQTVNLQQGFLERKLPLGKKSHPTQKSHVLRNCIHFYGPRPFRSGRGTMCHTTVLWLTATGSVEAYSDGSLSRE